MKRRELIKKTALAIGSTLFLSSCTKKDEPEKTVYQDDTQMQNNSSDNSEIVPKQTDIYKLSAPMLFDYSAIDELAECNKKYKKIKVKTLYNSIPWPLSSNYNEWIMLCRGGQNPDIKNFDDFAKYVKYSIDKGFEVCYLMNSPKAFNDLDLKNFKTDLYKLLDNLYKIGIRKIKFSNTQVAQLIRNHNPKFKLVSSTISEYNSIIQYRGLLHEFPNVTEIGLPKNENQNFKFIKALRKAFPDISIEIMLNEGCMKGCFSRYSCMASSYNRFYKLGCKLSSKDMKLNFYKNGRVYPWDLGYYSALGINNFKIVAMNHRASDNKQPYLLEFMDIAENGLESEYIRNFIIRTFRVHNFENHIHKFDIDEIISKYYPDIRYFIKNGHNCSTKCGIECNYCEERTKKLREFEEFLNV